MSCSVSKAVCRRTTNGCCRHASAVTSSRRARSFRITFNAYAPRSLPSPSPPPASPRVLSTFQTEEYDPPPRVLTLWKSASDAGGPFACGSVAAKNAAHEGGVGGGGGGGSTLFAVLLPSKQRGEEGHEGRRRGNRLVRRCLRARTTVRRHPRVHPRQRRRASRRRRRLGGTLCLFLRCLLLLLRRRPHPLEKRAGKRGVTIPPRCRARQRPSDRVHPLLLAAPRPRDACPCRLLGTVTEEAKADHRVPRRRRLHVGCGRLRRLRQRPLRGEGGRRRRSAGGMAPRDRGVAAAAAVVVASLRHLAACGSVARPALRAAAAARHPRKQQLRGRRLRRRRRRSPVRLAACCRPSRCRCRRRRRRWRCLRRCEEARQQPPQDRRLCCSGLR
eukprot:Rhum_TRINITY_DN14643_c6_g1::Rhum_TRINITY_DN14643_c6_g1_i1::g.107395::m.107395